MQCTLLTANITRIQNCLAISFDEEHHSARAVIGIEKGDSDPQSRSQFNLRGRVQWNWTLRGVQHLCIFDLKGELTSNLAKCL